MRRCKICGKRMKLKAESRYEVRIKKPRSALSLTIEPDTIAECFDCPSCGCQNMMQIRETDILRGDQNDS